MINSSLVFLDSGIGGLPYLEWIQKHRSSLALSYVADNANFPYGESSDEKIRNAVAATAKKIFSAGTPLILIIACNTASVAALDEVRKFAPCPVVGTVPAVKSAGQLPGKGPMGVLATQGTIQSAYLENLIHSFAAGKPVVKVAAGDIVRYVEERWLEEGDEGALPIMERALLKLKSSHVDSVVIGCTHFLHVMNPIAAYLGNAVRLVDSRDGVGRRILSLIEGKVETDGTDQGRGGFYVTKSSDKNSRYKEFAERFGLDWAGVLP